MVSLKLKPLNGWRHFFGEVGIIILGVLVALGLGAIATEIGWRVEARTARKAIGLELGESVGQAIERMRFSPCVEQRLDALGRIVDRSASEGRLPPVGDIAIPNFRTWNHGAWDSAVNAQTAAHFGRDELNAYVAAYGFVATLGETNQKEIEVWTRLYSLVGPGRELTASEAATLRTAIGEARVNSRFMALISLRLQQIVNAYDLPYDRSEMRGFSERPLSEKEICQPIGAGVPEQYGQAPFRGGLERARKAPITRRSP